MFIRIRRAIAGKLSKHHQETIAHHSESQDYPAGFEELKTLRQFVVSMKRVLCKWFGLSYVCLSGEGRTRSLVDHPGVENMDKCMYELRWRIPRVRPTPELQSYSHYVRSVRCEKEVDRADLARRTDLDRSVLTLLEHQLLEPRELTAEARSRIENALGITYNDFLKCEAETAERRSGHQLTRHGSPPDLDTASAT